MKRYCDIPDRYGADGLLPRTGLAAGGSAPYVLLPGDPHRSRIISPAKGFVGVALPCSFLLPLLPEFWGGFFRRVKFFIIKLIFCKNFSHSKKVRYPNGFLKFPLAIRINRV